MERKKVLVLNGSIRKEMSTSFVLSSYLFDKLDSKAFNCKNIFIYDALRNEIGTKEMIRAFNDSDIIILCYPLYVDSLPAGNIQALKLITDYRKRYRVQKNQMLLAIANCCFYEGHQTDNSINVCRFFAKENELCWYGGITVGGGAAYSGRELSKLGHLSRNMRLALDMIAECIMKNTALPVEKLSKLTTPVFPRFAYMTMTNMRMKAAARKNGIYKLLNSRPYAENWR